MSCGLSVTQTTELNATMQNAISRRERQAAGVKTAAVETGTLRLELEVTATKRRQDDSNEQGPGITSVWIRLYELGKGKEGMLE